MLDDATRTQLKDRLLDEIAECEQKVLDLEALTKPVAPDAAIGRLSRLESIQEKSVHEAALYQTRERLAKLENALIRDTDADFGVCTGCSQPIPMERLLLLPESTRCVRCAS